MGVIRSKVQGASLVVGGSRGMAAIIRFTEMSPVQASCPYLWCTPGYAGKCSASGRLHPGFQGIQREQSQGGDA